jgi:hypothetical protein
VLPVNVTLHVVVLELVQLVHDEKELLPAVEGAESAILVPELAVIVKLVEPVCDALLPFSV